MVLISQVLNASVSASFTEPNSDYRLSAKSAAPFAFLDFPRPPKSTPLSSKEKSGTEDCNSESSRMLANCDDAVATRGKLGVGFSASWTSSRPHLASTNITENGLPKRQKQSVPVDMDIETRVRELLGQQGRNDADILSQDRAVQGVPADMANENAETEAAAVAARLKENAAAAMMATWEREMADAAAREQQARLTALQETATNATASAAAAEHEREEAVAAASAARACQAELELQLADLERNHQRKKESAVEAARKEAANEVSAARQRQVELELRLEQLEKKQRPGASVTPATMQSAAVQTFSATMQSAAVQTVLGEREAALGLRSGAFDLHPTSTSYIEPEARRQTGATLATAQSGTAATAFSGADRAVGVEASRHQLLSGTAMSRSASRSPAHTL